jgi:hypothetical protein
MDGLLGVNLEESDWKQNIYKIHSWWHFLMRMRASQSWLMHLSFILEIRE